jgi:hypothetical protein
MFTTDQCGHATVEGEHDRKEKEMPQIIVTAAGTDSDDEAVLLRERVSVADFESDHFAAQLVERLGWAVSDASEVEHDPAKRG